MDYEKKYRDLVEAVKELQEANPSDEGIQNWVNDNLPELKESEDEKIRKELLQIAKESEDSFYMVMTPNKREKLIAWLKKQGQKPQGKSALEAAKEEKVDNQNCVKPNDKVEPKFHEGEWLCENESNNYARFIQILEIVNVQGKDRYRISRDIHNDEDIVEFDFVEKYYHKFDIQDAKDGDVLAAHECLVLFKEIDGLNIRCYYTYHYMNHQAFYVDTLQNKTAFHPATKEQREQLEKAITNAGYVWNAEKKELKEIDYHCTDVGKKEEAGVLKKMLDLEKEMITPEESLGIDSETYNKIVDECIYGDEQKPTDEEMKELLQTEYEKGRADAIAEIQKHWSEEDEEHIKSLLERLEGMCKKDATFIRTKFAVSEDEDWLKSLKDRMQPQQENERILGKLEEWLDEYISNLADVGTDTLIGSFRKYLYGKLPVKSQNR